MRTCHLQRNYALPRFIGERKLLLIKPTFAGAREIGFHGGWRGPSRMFWVSSPAQQENELPGFLT